jgi:DNA-binding CsgD family transcriptional regulator
MMGGRAERKKRTVADQADLLKQAHQAHEARRFRDADEAFEAADRLGDLSTEDVLTWWDSVWWLGRSQRALELAEVGYGRLLAEGQRVRAAKEAIGIGFLLMLRGDLAAGSGWLQRGRSGFEDSASEEARGYLVHLDAENALMAGDLDRAVGLARAAVEAARRTADPTLLSLALMTEGTAKLRSGSVLDGMALLDEAMLPVQAGQIPPEYAGNIYCQMIAICWELADLRRAREWTAATERWCADFDSSVMFSGICRMHRVQLRQVAGDWDVAADDARVVCTELVGMNVGVVAEGHYLLGDLLRLRGDLAGARAAYLRTHELGRDPQPGLALLAADEGKPESGRAMLSTALAAHQGADYALAPLLRATVELALECGDVGGAGEAADELGRIAGTWQTDGLVAEARQARGVVRLAAGDHAGAVVDLRDAIRRWHELDATYACARARIALAEALADLGDSAAADVELDAAAHKLDELDAVTDLRRVARLRPAAPSPGGLTPRELEILGRVADGSTNKQVATALTISEKTVARHLANIYLKLGVSTRTAAVAWAHRSGVTDA